MKRSYEVMSPKASCSGESTSRSIQVQPPGPLELELATQTLNIYMDNWTQTCKIEHFSPEATTSPTTLNEHNGEEVSMQLNNDENQFRIVDNTDPLALKLHQLPKIRRNPPRKAKSNIEIYTPNGDSSEKASESSDEIVINDEEMAETPRADQNQEESEGDENLDEKIAALQSLVMKWNRKTDIEFMIGVYALKYHVRSMNDYSSSSMNVLSTELHENNATKLNLAMCSFVRDCRRTDNSAIGADDMYYMLLGIQQYLQQKGRTDNIFFDDNYQELKDLFDQLVSKRQMPSNNYDSMITERFLWKTKQLGNNTGRGLLFTLVYFNTKFFRLNTIEKHKQLTVRAAIKYWKSYNEIRGANRSPNNADIASNGNDIEVYYKAYFSACPPNLDKRCTFYLTPLNNMAANKEFQYSETPLNERLLQGWLNIAQMVQEVIFSNATQFINRFE